MKQVSEIKDSIEQLLAMPQIDEKTKKRLKSSVLKARGKKVRFLSVCKLYLESGPSEEFCKDEVVRLNQRLTFINNTFPQDKKFATLVEEKDFKKNFNKEWDVPHIKEQIKALKFLLK
jgi:hypothetical protein